MATRAAPTGPISMNPLNRYLQEIRKYTILSHEEETSLAERWISHRDPAAAERLATSHLALIVKCANGYRGYGVPLADLVAEGNVGMMQAIGRFDPSRGIRLSTYAIWWIRAAILEYILRSYSIVRLCTTQEHKRLFFKLNRIKNRLKVVESGDLAAETVATIARELSVSPNDVITMNRRLDSQDRSLNAPITADGDGEWQDWLVDPNPDQEELLGEREEYDERRTRMAQAMTQLNAREYHILTARRLSERPPKLDELATHYGVSRERIRQIEECAFVKLQEALGLIPARQRRRRAVPPAANEDFSRVPPAYALPEPVLHRIHER